MSRLGTETAFAVLLKARALEAQGREIIHLEIGEPDFDTPSNIVEAGVKALRDGQTHYTPSAGIPQLREAIAEEISTTRGIMVNPDQVVVTPGAKPIMFFTILALCEEGDEVIYPNPHLRINDQLRRGHTRAHPAIDGKGLPRRHRTVQKLGLPQNQDDHPQLAPQPHWGRADQGGPGSHC